MGEASGLRVKDRDARIRTPPPELKMTPHKLALDSMVLVDQC